MRELWSKPAVSFHGKYVNFDDIVCNPKPMQQPGPPILIGSTDKTRSDGSHAGAMCFVTEKAVSFMRRKLSELKDECEKVGRDFSTLDVTLMISLNGDCSQVQELLGQLGELDLGRVVEVNASEPLFVGDYRAKIERLARITL